MIKKIEFEEKGMKNYLTILNLEENKLTIYQNGEKTKEKEVLINERIFKDLVDTYVLPWNFIYKSERPHFDLGEANLNIYIDSDIVTYAFIGEYPEHYTDFANEFRRLVDML